MNLVIVETLDKALRLRPVLGRRCRVMVFPGPARALVAGGLTVSAGGEVEERYEIPSDSLPLVEDLRAPAGKAWLITCATAPGQEGEALAWNISQCLPEGDRARVRRVVLPWLDDEVIREAFDAPCELDLRLVDAWRARRVIDLLVSVAVSPELRRWKLHRDAVPETGLAEMAALRLVVEREWRRHTATYTHRWAVRAQLEKDRLRLWTDMASNPDIGSESEAYALVDLLMQPEISWHIEALEEHEVSEAPDPPFTTAALLAAASQALRFLPGQTIQAAQQLYDKGLITHTYTASTRVSPDAQAAARRVIQGLYGREALPDEPPVDGQTEEAEGEAIRPASISLHPEVLDLEELEDLGLSHEARVLYSLIWRRFMASGMRPARDTVITATIRPCWTGSVEPWEDPATYPHPFTFRAELRQTTATGFRRAYEGLQLPEGDLVNAVLMDMLDKGDELRLSQITASEVEDPLPHRYTAAGLIGDLERRGIGHAETCAAMIEGLIAKGYVRLEKGDLAPTPLGEDVLYVCVQRLPEVFRLEAAAEVEAMLGRVACGEMSRRDALDAFARRLSPGTSQPLARNAVEEAVA